MNSPQIVGAEPGAEILSESSTAICSVRKLAFTVGKDGEKAKSIDDSVITLLVILSASGSRGVNQLYVICWPFSTKLDVVGDCTTSLCHSVPLATPFTGCPIKVLLKGCTRANG